MPLTLTFCNQIRFRNPTKCSIIELENLKSRIEIYILFTGSMTNSGNCDYTNLGPIFLLLYLVRQKFRENVKIRIFIIGCWIR